MNSANHYHFDENRRSEVLKLAEQMARVLTAADAEERPILELWFARTLYETLNQINGGVGAKYLTLKSPPLTPELREWLDQQHTEEEILAWLQEAKEKGGLEFHEFLHELEEIVGQP